MREITPEEATWLAMIGAYRQRQWLKYLGPIAKDIALAILDGVGSKQDLTVAKGIILWANQCKDAAKKRRVRTL
ncbi:MAG: hypothetical protein KGI27_10055 [Thaumarchaeota archaeon]|nr:hypothetical protein [Nitrososphaerota archaeon]